MSMKKKKKSKKKGTIETDAEGQFRWETYFVQGKQKRRKLRLIDGGSIVDIDDYLLRNADDIYLHQIERWDLIEQRRLEQQAPAEDVGPEPAPRVVPLNIELLEQAFDYFESTDLSLMDGYMMFFLNLATGKLVSGECEEECGPAEDLLEFPESIYEILGDGQMEEFISSLEDGKSARKLAQAMGEKRPLRKFKRFISESGSAELKHSWCWFETRRKRECIVEWLKSCGIDPQWDCDIFEPPPMPNKRNDLLRAVLRFVRAARRISGVRRIALLGSLTTDKAIPKDVDLLVEMSDEKSLSQLAKVKRQLSGLTMQTGDSCGADVFLCNSEGGYLGRICHWKECRPGIRASCHAEHCGQRQFLCDDLQVVTLDRKLLVSPPLDLWPRIIERSDLPDDVRKELIEPLARGDFPKLV